MRYTCPVILILGDIRSKMGRDDPPQVPDAVYSDAQFRAYSLASVSADNVLCLVHTLFAARSSHIYSNTIPYILEMGDRIVK